MFLLVLGLLVVRWKLRKLVKQFDTLDARYPMDCPVIGDAATIQAHSGYSGSSLATNRFTK